MKKYWATAADHGGNVFYSEIVKASSYSEAMETAMQAVPAEFHDTICISEEE